jgi:N-acyl-D-aspartate/D-glutamate deacylase
MAYDLLIKNGTVVDGSGGPRYQADVAVAGGKVVDIGKINEDAKRKIDASDLIVAPGFIDPHTHYDAQVCWDSQLTCSSWHGVTTVITGNCGVGIAPCRPDAREIVAWDLVNVEGIPFEVLKKGVTWDWESFPDFMDAEARRGSALNVGCFAPLTPFRHYVMGEESMERAARPEEAARIRALLREAVAAGAFGFSTTNTLQHAGYKGRPLACRLASNEELRAYAGVLKELGKGVIEIALTRTRGQISEEEWSLLEMLLDESGRPVTWIAIEGEEMLRKVEPLVARGAIPQIRCTATLFEFTLRSPGLVFASIAPSWTKVFNQPAEVQKQIYADPAFRNEFREKLAGPRGSLINWERFEFGHANKPGFKPLEGKTIAQIAAGRGTDCVDAFLDVGIEDDLESWFTMIQDSERQAPFITDPRVMIALSDGGAHVDAHCDAGYPTYLLGTWSRKRQVISLEAAVRRLTSEPAGFLGLKDRGRLAPGLAADITVFDYNTIDSADRQEMRKDLPGGALRFVMPARGVEYTVINGEVAYEHGRHTGKLAGRMLRSGVN